MPWQVLLFTFVPKSRALSILEVRSSEGGREKLGGVESEPNSERGQRKLEFIEFKKCIFNIAA